MLEENTPDTTQTTYTVSQLNQAVRFLLESHFTTIWVEGEVSNAAFPSSGHWYFSLKDAGAQVRCAMFSARNRALPFKLENGMHVLAHAKISLYEPRGDFQLIVERIEPAGEGALRLAFEKLKQRLASEGLFAAVHKKPLPPLPHTIGVITSPTGAAIRDILIVLKRRFASIPVIIYPTLVQGSSAAQHIAKAINIANQRNECEILVVARGGGSLEDLWPFNEEIVARAIFASKIPIVTGVGHEVDFTIADLVADHRAPTPSAAELISPDARKWQHDLVLTQQRLTNHLRITLQHLNHSLISLSKRLRHPKQLLQEQYQRLDYLEQNLKRALQTILQKKQAQWVELSRALNAISPLATLQRGYAIVTHASSGKIIRSAKEIAIGEKVTARVAEGQLECTVDKT